MNDTTNTAETTATAIKLTGREALVAKYAKAHATYEKAATALQAVVDAINEYDALAAIGVDSQVIITIGKGEAAKEVQATVIGVREGADGSKTLKVTYGEGFDADVATVPASKVKLAPVGAPAIESPAVAETQSE